MKSVQMITKAAVPKAPDTVSTQDTKGFTAADRLSGNHISQSIAPLYLQ